MTNKNENIVYINRWAIGLILFGLLCIAQFIYIYQLKVSHNVNAIGIAVLPLLFGLFYLITGVGLKMKTKWSYYSFKLALVLIFPLLPIGTLLSLHGFKRLKDDNLKEMFC